MPGLELPPRYQHQDMKVSTQKCILSKFILQ